MNWINKICLYSLILFVFASSLEVELNYNNKNIQEKRRSACMVVGSNYFAHIHQQFQKITEKQSQIKKKIRQNRVKNELFQACQRQISQLQIQNVLEITQQLDRQNQYKTIISQFKEFYQQFCLAELFENLQNQQKQFVQRQIKQAHQGRQKLEQAGSKLTRELNKILVHTKQMFDSLSSMLNRFLNITTQIHNQGTKKASKLKQFWDEL